MSTRGIGGKFIAVVGNPGGQIFPKVYIDSGRKFANMPPVNTTRVIINDDTLNRTFSQNHNL